jgi:hypothetical protein
VIISYDAIFLRVSRGKLWWQLYIDGLLCDGRSSIRVKISVPNQLVHSMVSFGMSSAIVINLLMELICEVKCWN